jgi:hypothetical protein
MEQPLLLPQQQTPDCGTCWLLTCPPVPPQKHLYCWQVEMTKKETEFNTQLSMQADRHRTEVAALQHKLSQRGFDLVKRQHEMAGLRQQLEEALLRAKRAEASKAAIW